MADDLVKIMLSSNNAQNKEHYYEPEKENWVCNQCPNMAELRNFCSKIAR